MLQADAILSIERFVDAVFYVYILLVFVYILLSWIPLPYNVWLSRFQRFLYDVVEPYLRVFRRFLPQLSVGGMGLDLSPILAIFVLYAARELITRGLDQLR